MLTVLIEWLAREGWMIFNWWWVVTLAGLVALPITARLLSSLPDKGYLFARAAGLLLTGFTFWLLASLGILRNNAGNIALAWTIVFGVGLIVHFRAAAPFDWRGWWRDNRQGIIIGEIIFALVLVGWCVYRAHQHEIYTTEKPMDVAFMSAIMRSETFPPVDPWASGYSISYYYFGYVIAAMISTLAGTVSTAGYNIWTAMLFALTALGGYGVVYNLIRTRGSAARTAVSFGAVAAILIAVMSNYQFPLVELPYQTGTAPAGWLAFWDVRERELPKFTETELTAEQTDIGRWTGWWWFRAARVIKDRTLDGNGTTEVISEFPMFSYVLADNHPHVMALPFTLLAMAMGLNILLTRRAPSRQETLFYGLVVGGLVFLNTWDSPIYMVVLVGADLLRRFREHGGLTFQNRPNVLLYTFVAVPLTLGAAWWLPPVKQRVRRALDLAEEDRLIVDDWVGLLTFAAALLAITVIAYAPFLVSFRSQLSGILPNIYLPTRFPQYLLTFGALVPLLALFLGVEAWRGRRTGQFALGFGVQISVMILLALVGVAALLVIGGTINPAIRANAVIAVESAGGWDAVSGELLARRLEALPTLLLMLGGLVIIVGRLFASPAHTSQDSTRTTSYSAATGYALLLAGAAIGLTLIPEFVYLRDNFGYRMNTVFKFYYQAWAMAGVAAAYGLYSLLADREHPLPVAPRTITAILAAGFILLGLLYAPLAFVGKGMVEAGHYNNPTPPQLTLDGGRSLTTNADYAVLQCLQEIVGKDDVVLAAGARGPFDSYTYYGGGGIGSGRAGALIGIPTVWGWGGHQAQWRGNLIDEVKSTRYEDLQTLYTAYQMSEVQPIIERWKIDYILYGDVERNDQYYGSVGEEKFRDNLPVVCEAGNSRVYRTNYRSQAQK